MAIASTMKPVPPEDSLYEQQEKGKAVLAHLATSAQENALNAAPFATMNMHKERHQGFCVFQLP